MSSELKYIEETLAEKYPNIDTNKYIWQELIRKQAIGVGWHELIIQLVQKIEETYKEWDTPIEQFKITDIKEKYGTLRFDCLSSIDAVFDIILKAELKSESICEHCGKTGKIRTDRHWILTLCDDCNDADK